jgi:LysR family hydrogen peroxide-inducible transcriptional activator
MTLNQLVYALELQKQKNFQRAADQLSISQPALSIQIKKLEEELDILLFNRNVNPLEVTRDGELFLIRAQELVSSARQLENFAYELKEDFKGTLVVGIIPTLAPFLVPLFSQNFIAKYPDLRLIIKEQMTEQVIRNLRAGEIDAGIISTPLQLYGINSIPLLYERFYLYASSRENIHSAEISIEEINQSNLWLLDEGNCFRDQVTNFCNLDVIRNGKQFVYQSNSIDALIRIIDIHGGMTILPELTTLSLDSFQEENLKRIKGKPKAREIGLVVTSNYNKARFVNVLAAIVKENIPSHMLNGDHYDILDPNIQMN